MFNPINYILIKYDTSRLTHRNITKRYRAGDKLGSMNNGKGLEPLAEALRDKSPEVSSAAAFGLSNSCNPKVCDYFIRDLSDPDEEIRISAVFYLGMCMNKWQQISGDLFLILASKLREIKDPEKINSLIPSVKNEIYGSSLLIVMMYANECYPCIKSLERLNWLEAQLKNSMEACTEVNVKKQIRDLLAQLSQTKNRLKCKLLEQDVTGLNIEAKNMEPTQYGFGSVYRT